MADPLVDVVSRRLQFSYIGKRVLFSTTAAQIIRQLNEGVVSDDLRDAFTGEPDA